MLREMMESRALLPILKMDDGRTVTPELWSERRKEMRNALEKYSYGRTPPAPDLVNGRILEQTNEECAGKVRLETIEVSFSTERGEFRFPFILAVPLQTVKPPVFLHIAFERTLPEWYTPLEEITDSGYAVALLCYTDIVNDNHFGDFSDGLARYFGVGPDRGEEEWGKIGMWAYGASRVLDYLITREDLDALHTAVIGHSRLGKTALWAAAQDERFFAAVSNDSGYGGAATSKHGTGERVRDFLQAGSWDWYCENFKKFADEKEDAKPYDQAYLLALIAPRFLCVGSAEQDFPADPISEYLTSLWASQAWNLLGQKGLITPDCLPEPGDTLFEGNVGYQYRAGTHYLSREDWNRYIAFMDKKRG